MKFHDVDQLLDYSGPQVVAIQGCHIDWTPSSKCKTFHMRIKQENSDKMFAGCSFVEKNSHKFHPFFTSPTPLVSASSSTNLLSPLCYPSSINGALDSTTVLPPSLLKLGSHLPFVDRKHPYDGGEHSRDWPEGEAKVGTVCGGDVARKSFFDFFNMSWTETSSQLRHDDVHR